MCVLQAYLAAPEAAPEGIQFAKQALCAFTSEEFAPGEARRITLHVQPEGFRYWQEGEGWRMLSQPRTLLLGFSSEELPLSIRLD